MRGLKLPLALILSASVLTPAFANVIPNTAKTYFAAESSNPALASEYLRGHPGDAIEIVTFHLPDQQTDQDFYALGPVARSRLGVCRFTSVQIFPHPANDGKVVWNRTPLKADGYVLDASSMALVTNGACPKQDDQTYTGIDRDITDAEFVDIASFWKELSSSEEKFDAAFIYLKARSADFAPFKAATFHATRGLPALGGVSRFANGSYAMSFSDCACSQPTSATVLVVSKSPLGFKVLDFSVEQY
jgi:hypothetical protein